MTTDTTRSMTMVEAIRDAHMVAMERDERVVVFGEDVGFFGGVFRCTQGLQERFGDHRCFDSPISESGIVGAAVENPLTQAIHQHGVRQLRERPVKPHMQRGDGGRREFGSGLQLRQHVEHFRRQHVRDAAPGQAQHDEIKRSRRLPIATDRRHPLR